MGHNQDSYEKLLTQIRKYKTRRAPYNQPYNFKTDTPIIWWETAQNTRDELELQTLALRIFAVTPHSASCERSFSVLGWFYGQRRTNLTIERVEVMCKLHTFYITNAKSELPHYAIDISENQLRTQMIDSMMCIGDELEGVTEADFDDRNAVDMEIDTPQVNCLDIAKVIDLESQIFNMERQQNVDDDQITNQRQLQAVLLNSQHDDFDIEALAREIIDD